MAINKGESHALIGPNGAGKTTLVKMVSTIYIPLRGESSLMVSTPNGRFRVLEEILASSLVEILAFTPGQQRNRIGKLKDIIKHSGVSVTSTLILHALFKQNGVSVPIDLFSHPASSCVIRMGRSSFWWALRVTWYLQMNWRKLKHCCLHSRSRFLHVNL
ncbi:ATP-binding cassette domain-containing protein [Gleimia sp. 6138-11-ORH1]|uniref:ATP-binding cassette domain-containing protein n=1 Tax=Gleimia sp. 6138-11-ORH1 TaxID=2973937 RepID=UPI0037BFE0EC